MPNSTLATLPARPQDRFMSAFQLEAGRALNGTNTTLRELRREAMDRFSTLGLPTRKNEAWKYTPIEKVLAHDYRLQLAPTGAHVTRRELAPFLVPGLEAHVAVLLNGRFSEPLSRIGSLPDGVIVTGFAQASELHHELVNRHFARYAAYEDEVFTALNTAFTQDGLFVYVPRNVVLEKPIHLLTVLSAEEDVLLQPRTLLVFEEGSQARVVETNHALTRVKTFVNSVAEVYVGPRAHVDYYRIQDEGPQASQVATTQVYQKGDSVFSLHTVTLDGAVVRNNVSVLPDAAHCETHLLGLYLPRGRQHVDTHTLIDHARPDCVSNELYKGVLDDQASGVFNGKVLVRPDAQKTNAFQENKTILLTTEASMNAKPELEIYADDVKCSHGATTGQIDREGLFYLRSRGLSEQQARALLLLAFARDVVEKVRLTPLRDHLDALISARFHAAK